MSAVRTVTLPVGSYVADRLSGKPGRIAAIVPAMGTEGAPTYGINWIDGTSGSGWTDLDVKIRK